MKRRYCAFGCRDLEAYGVSLHKFPNPETKPDLFQRWISAVGVYLKESDPKKIFLNKKVCSCHFLSCEITTGNRLIWSAVPSVQLFPLHQSPTTVSNIDHTYCLGVRRSLLFTENKHITSRTEQTSNNDSKINSAITKGNFTHKEAHNEDNLEGAAAIPESALIIDTVANEVVPDYEVREADCDIIMDDICANVGFEEVICYDDEPDHCDDTISEDDKSNNIIDEFLRMHPDKSSLPTAEQEINSEPNDCNEISSEYDKSSEIIVQYFITSGTENSVPLLEQGNDYDKFFLIAQDASIKAEVTTEEPDGEESIKRPAVMHTNIVCDNCNRKIVGLRYKCLHCVGYNHCHKCEKQQAHSTHYMIRMSKSPDSQIPEAIIYNLCDDIRPIINPEANNLSQEFIPRHNEPESNNLNFFDCDVDLPSDVKALIRGEVTRVVKNKLVDITNNGKRDGKIKRKIIMPNDIAKRTKMNIQTIVINDKCPGNVKMGSSDRVPGSEFENSLHCETNDKPAVARIDYDEKCPGALHMTLSYDVSRLVMEIIRDGKKILYQYVDS